MAHTFLPNPNNTGSKGITNTYPAVPMTESIQNGLFTVDQQWTVKYWNKSAEQILGVKAKDIVGKNLWAQFARSLPPDFYAVYHKAFLSNIPVHFREYWGEMGAWFDVITYYSNDVLAISFKNISKPKEMATRGDQLKTLNELYKFVTEITNDCLWEWDITAREIFWIDGGHKRVFGYPIENAVITQDFWENNMHPNDRPRIIAGLSKIINEAMACIWEDEYRFKKTNGEYAYVHDRAHIIYTEGVATRMIGATQDISSRKLTEIKLLETEKKLSLIAWQTVNAVIITDAEEKIIWVNNAFTRITGFEPAEVMGKKPGSLLQGPDTNPATVAYLRQQMKAKKPFDCEIINYHKSGGMYWVRVQGQPLFDELGNCDRFFAIETDITERILLENKLVMERSARESQVTDAVLTAQENERENIGKELHDNINQILAIAKLYVQMSQKNDHNRDMYIAESSALILRAIDEIRKISKTLIIPDKHLIGLFDNIRNLLADVATVQSIKFTFYEPAFNEDELTEKIQLNIFRIIQEQLNNILKHSKASQAEISLTKHEDEFRLSISDNGAGFDMSKERQGVGIRNIMSRAELCLGTAEIESAPGQGFLLKVIMPFPAPLPALV